MPLLLPILYLITSGKTTSHTTPASKDFSRILRLVEAAVAAGVSILQIREKKLTTKVLYELVCAAKAITRGSTTLLLVNDRIDVALAAGADGVHLTATSIGAGVIREGFGAKLLIGCSTHSLEEAIAASDEGADFVVFGPVFVTASKQTYGEPLGLTKLREASERLAPFPVVALGGVNRRNAADCFAAGASGVAGISMFHQPQELPELVAVLRESFLR